MDEERLYEAAEVAESLHVAVEDVRRWLGKGLFPGAFRVPNRQAELTGRTGWRIPQSAYSSFLSWARDASAADLNR